jgi:MazG family protein
MNHNSKDEISKLLEIMDRLRDPVAGCAWDRAQTFETIAPYTLEEAFEVADAIERRAWAEVADELGDLLFQVVFHARMGSEAGLFDFSSIAAGICEKLVRRHPHVFAGQPQPSDQHADWEAIKRDERALAGRSGVLDGIPRALPALTRAAKLGSRAASVGFDWPDSRGAREKVDEELAELDEACAQGATEAVEAEFGDVLFALSNLARHLQIDPEQALRASSRRFERRFAHLEAAVRRSGRPWQEQSAEELDRCWNAAKAAEAAQNHSAAENH